ncbi:hypothetical protein AX016_1668 [Cellulophaga sp. RHA19]|uniref:alpha/beta hydrolase n=1 Tax=Cellulophaga sp. RHA19 TaxID=1798237 RepID=UPI000C2C42CF|nr:alpha/beta hydrolase [Cellulophaga sp. RHA19]PKB43468.1 hypothetical protein AX016_1668 [Cellulophaga sp. RHA19]
MKKLLILCLVFPILIFAQEVKTEELDLKNGDISLPGTLTVAPSKKKTPLLIFIQGSGNGDRNGNQAGTAMQIGYIKTLRDSLNTKGISFYSYDKRSANINNLKSIKDISFKGFVDDANVAIDYFKNDKRFSSITIIGHSQGSLVGMLAINSRNDKAVTSYISLAGPGKTFDKTIVEQLTAQNPSLGQAAKEQFEELVQTDTIKEVNPLLMSVFQPIYQKFIKEWATVNPATEIKKLQIPVLLLNGDSDLQVSTDDAQLLKDAHPKATLKIIPKMNHVLKVVNSIVENQEAYTSKDYKISNELINTIDKFVSK